MSRTAFAFLMAGIAGVVLIAMVVAWRARIRREPAVQGLGAAPTGEVIVSFPKASYVSTTPVGAPFERAAIPGLQYKGYAALTVQSDAVTIEVTGEAPVHIPSKNVVGSTTAGGRIGKVVERDGLSLLVWRADSPGTESRELESSFRFSNPSEQQAFAEAIEKMSNNTTQEDA